MSNTLQQIAEATYGSMHIKSDSTVFDYSKRVVPLLNKLQGDICVGSLNNMIDPARSYMSPVLSFVQKQAFYETKNDTSITVDASSGTTELFLDPSEYPSQGALYVGGCVVTYSGKTAYSVTGVSGLIRSVTAGMSAKLVFEVPADFAKPYECVDVSNGERQIEFIDDRDQKYGTYFTVKVSNDGTKQFLLFSTENATVRLGYVRNPTEMADPTDETVLPNNYGCNLLAQLAAGTLLYAEYGDDTLGLRGKSLLVSSYAELTTFYEKYAVKTKKHRKVVMRKPWNTNF